MDQISSLRPRFINMLTTYRLLIVICLWAFSINTGTILAQTTEDAIKELKEGYLIIRFPSYKAKIDMLQSMIKKEDHPVSEKRLQKLLDEAIYDRDVVRKAYMDAFQNDYTFSRVAYFYDHESGEHNDTQYYLLDDTPVSKNELSSVPVYFLHFERTGESKVDGLVIYNAENKKIPYPFPNNFTRSGIDLRFLGLKSSNPVPTRKVARINKRLHKYWNEVR